MICAATGPSSCLPFGVAGSAIHDLDFSHSLGRLVERSYYERSYDGIRFLEENRYFDAYRAKDYAIRTYQSEVDPNRWTARQPF